MLFTLIKKVFAQEGFPGSSEMNVDGGSEFNIADEFKLANGVRVSDVYTDPATVVNIVVRAVFILAGFVLFYMILLSGFKFISNTSKGKEDAKKIMEASLIGFVLMFISFWIIQVIQVFTGTTILF